MRIHDMVRLLLGLVFLAALPTGSALRKGGACTVDADCGVGSCCKVDLTCSRRLPGSIIAGRRADDICECVSQIFDTVTKRCGCSVDTHCKGARCCTADGTCSKRGVATVLPGRVASDACECTSGGITPTTERCMCSDAFPDCEDNKCCKANDICSTRDKASVLVGIGAADVCECASGGFNTATRKCGCSIDSHCTDNKCCTEDGTCSRRAVGSVLAGRIPDNVCECASSAVFATTGRCTCSDDSHCAGDTCCGVNGRCSIRDIASVSTGKAASDVCECAAGTYDAATKRCGCSIDRHCAGNTCCKANFHCSSVDAASILTGMGPAEDACECVTGSYNSTSQLCVCARDSHCEGNTCCKADNTCSERDVSSVQPGGTAADACECSTRAYSSETGQCKCSTDRHCAGAKCCGVNNTCSLQDESSVAPGSTASDACECMRKGGFKPAVAPDAAFCGCVDDSHCSGDKCCTADGTCSKKAVASVALGGKASDACECVSSTFNAVTGRCVCGDDSHCAGDKCCGEAGTCSVRAIASVAAGLVASDACECATGVHFPGSSPDKGRCGCADDTDCANSKCCREDNRCSARMKGTVAPLFTAGDKCECSSLSYDSTRGVCGCTEDVHCAANAEEICSTTTSICQTVGAVGDPHMTGFSGQKFDFTGKDGGWYALISEPPSLQLNMRVTVPVPSLPSITYITGFSLLTTDDDGLDHSIVVTAKEPHNLETACPVGISPCLADGSLTVTLDGEEALAAPATVSLAPGIEITAVNTPGECRSFGFETYWERKKQESAGYWANKQQENAQDNRKLGVTLSMGEWILANPTATNIADCTEYVARSEAVAGGLFAHQSEHSAFRIVTPAAKIRLSHGKLHQLAQRDPTNTIDLPDHVTWQMNIAIDHTEVSKDAKGVLGETIVPVRDADGNAIMHGGKCIRGVQTDYAVEGPLGTAFSLDNSDASAEEATGGTLP